MPAVLYSLVNKRANCLSFRWRCWVFGHTYVASCNKERGGFHRRLCLSRSVAASHCTLKRRTIPAPKSRRVKDVKSCGSHFELWTRMSENTNAKIITAEISRAENNVSGPSVCGCFFIGLYFDGIDAGENISNPGNTSTGVESCLDHRQKRALLRSY